ncbi:histone-lysine N-methyltransferase SETMAR-like [Ptiloglossa arizonensis]|uniref:histone-lysine N-methyltransferase SETMAR-like n=1 Tax=Ptiloglossa arizonensis TaxID=3350558 RepID=UPI003FA060B8
MEQKHIRMRLSQRHLERFKKDKKDFMRRFIIKDETWFEPVTSVRAQKSAKKVLASVFWDAKGILLVDYLQIGKTINSDYYSNLLDQLDTTSRTAYKTITRISELKYELLQRLPYSLDLTPLDLWLVSHLKEFMRGKRFSSNEEVQTHICEVYKDAPLQD